jgi:predicted RNA methylase
MGYYPTPLSVVELIRTHLSLPGEITSNVLDPCCGEGLALEALVRGTKMKSYGIELDGERAPAAGKRLAHVVHAGYEEVEISPGSMGLLFLNPPYDDGEGERKELTFLRDLIDTLMSGGILVYIIPQARLSPVMARVLAANFTQLRVVRFPDPEFEGFGQIVVLGRKTDWPMDNRREAERLAGLRDNKELPALEKGWHAYLVPITGNAIVRRRSISTESILALARTSPLWGRVGDLTKPASTAMNGQPPTRLHVGHLGLLLAAGRLNGVVGQGKDRHLVVGKPEKHIVESTEMEEGDDGSSVKVEKRLETFRVTIKTLLPSGEVRRLI